ncbi:hypothetical protein QFC24_000649 [Naganishia onofrii]|uniref:Uncharacterized protein n=1 Tax=Naganishia onofrii TaxID=1851511 RepID=A0ACC2XXN9_9TREE|nr:hypothetical protein QFC24_000649 [Naganishia onofrii]
MYDFISRYQTFPWLTALQICLSQHATALTLDVSDLEQRDHPDVQSADDAGGGRTQDDHGNFDIAIWKGLLSYNGMQGSDKQIGKHVVRVILAFPDQDWTQLLINQKLLENVKLLRTFIRERSTAEVNDRDWDMFTNPLTTQGSWELKNSQNSHHDVNARTDSIDTREVAISGGPSVGLQSSSASATGTAPSSSSSRPTGLYLYPMRLANSFEFLNQTTLVAATGTAPSLFEFATGDYYAALDADTPTLSRSATPSPPAEP